MVYRVTGSNVIIEGIYHELQDYENSIMKIKKDSVEMALSSKPQTSSQPQKVAKDQESQIQRQMQLKPIAPATPAVAVIKPATHPRPMTTLRAPHQTTPMVMATPQMTPVITPHPKPQSPLQM